MLTKDAILGLVEKPVAMLNVPEWGGDVGIRALSAAEMLDLGNRPDNEEKGLESLARFCALVVCDENGKRVFSAGDVPSLMQRGAVILARIQQAALDANILTKETREAAEKN